MMCGKGIFPFAEIDLFAASFVVQLVEVGGAAAGEKRRKLVSRFCGLLRKMLRDEKSEPRYVEQSAMVGRLVARLSSSDFMLMLGQLHTVALVYRSSGMFMES